MADRAKALARARKLKALTDPERGGTEGERAVANAKLGRLIAEHGFTPAELVEVPVARRPLVRPAQPASGFPFGRGFDDLLRHTRAARSAATADEMRKMQEAFYAASHPPRTSSAARNVRVKGRRIVNGMWVE